MKKVTKKQVYEVLIRKHHWTFEEIANLNMWQQAIAAGIGINDTSDSIVFHTEEDYLRWKAGKIDG